MTQPNKGLHRDVVIKVMDACPISTPPHITDAKELYDYRMKLPQSSMMSGASHDLSKPFKAMTFGDLYRHMYHRDLTKESQKRNEKQSAIWDAMSENQKDQMYADLKEQERRKKRDQYIFDNWKH
jgi:hypothetical protein